MSEQRSQLASQIRRLMFVGWICILFLFILGLIFIGGDEPDRSNPYRMPDGNREDENEGKVQTQEVVVTDEHNQESEEQDDGATDELLSVNRLSDLRTQLHPLVKWKLNQLKTNSDNHKKSIARLLKERSAATQRIESLNRQLMQSNRMLEERGDKIQMLRQQIAEHDQKIQEIKGKVRQASGPARQELARELMQTIEEKSNTSKLLFEYEELPTTMSQNNAEKNKLLAYLVATESKKNEQEEMYEVVQGDIRRISELYGSIERGVDEQQERMAAKLSPDDVSTATKLKIDALLNQGNTLANEIQNERWPIIDRPVLILAVQILAYYDVAPLTAGQEIPIDVLRLHADNMGSVFAVNAKYLARDELTKPVIEMTEAMVEQYRGLVEAYNSVDYARRQNSEPQKSELARINRYKSGLRDSRNAIVNEANRVAGNNAHEIWSLHKLELNVAQQLSSEYRRKGIAQAQKRMQKIANSGATPKEVADKWIKHEMPRSGYAFRSAKYKGLAEPYSGRALPPNGSYPIINGRKEVAVEYSVEYVTKGNYVRIGLLSIAVVQEPHPVARRWYVRQVYLNGDPL